MFAIANGEILTLVWVPFISFNKWFWSFLHISHEKTFDPICILHRFGRSKAGKCIKCVYLVNKLRWRFVCRRVVHFAKINGKTTEITSTDMFRQIFSYLFSSNQYRFHFNFVRSSSVLFTIHGTGRIVYFANKITYLEQLGNANHTCVHDIFVYERFDFDH